MKKYAAMAVALAVSGQLVSPVYARSLNQGGVFNDTTMLGWKRTSEPAAVAYFKLPLQSSDSVQALPRAGFMISSPRTYAAGAAVPHQTGRGMVDLGFTGRDFYSPWTASLNVSGQTAWTSNPDAMPKNTTYMFESGTSWVIVGVASAALITGIYLASEN